MFDFSGIFSLYINDLVDALNESKLGVNIDQINVAALFYTDDIVLISTLQKLLEIVYNWYSKWRLSINVQKSKIVHFRPRGTSKSSTVFKCGEDTLEITDSYKYLGWWLDEHFEFKLAVRELSKSASRALGLLTSKFIWWNDFLSIFKIIRKSAIWSQTEHKVINNVQNRATKIFLGLTKNTSNINRKTWINGMDVLCYKTTNRSVSFIV